ncbi:uncharacterized protein PRCAT00002786001 [Priceomyces carsonii]|uniref:uncharacterized protein n=1 Tax=Priceomyces carsonii TaxID=28549 RepID=UPI002EDA944E|nr:unnamed protein product [Priceomyces carsonii]
MPNSPKNEANPYIPKYIIKKPWYKEDSGSNNPDSDYLSHHRNKNEVIDYSLPTAGGGINDSFDVKENFRVKRNEDYDSKRDRWYGYEADQWDNILRDWQKIKKKSKTQSSKDEQDSDDTDYELELIELGLDAKDIVTNLKEDPMERVIRDRMDIPSYVKKVTASKLNKSKALVNEDDQFVRAMGELQKFAWDQNEEYLQSKRTELLESKLQNKPDAEPTYANLDLNVEANPTLMHMKLKEHNEEKKSRKDSLAKKYGGSEYVKDNQIHEFRNSQ